MPDAPVALLLSGRGRYADPWHPFDRTSDALASIAREEGLIVSETDDVDAALAAAASGPLPDLVLADLGRPQDGRPSPSSDAAAAGLERLVSSRPVLAMHASANTFPDSAAWTATVGARWVPGISWHPVRDELTAMPASATLPTPIGVLGDFTLTDERYLDLQPAARRIELYRHRGDDGTLQPSVWLQDRAGVRSAYDAYGHDEESYRSDGHRDLIRRVLRWLLAGQPTLSNTTST